MKIKLIMLLLTIATLFSACKNAGDTQEYNVVVKYNNVAYKVKTIWLSQTDYIYVMYPANGKDSIPLQVTTKISNGDDDTKTETTVILK